MGMDSRKCPVARRLRLERLKNRRLLATVTTLSDVVDPDEGVLSLREAIASAVPGEFFESAVSGTYFDINLHILNTLKAAAFNANYCFIFQPPTHRLLVISAIPLIQLKHSSLFSGRKGAKGGHPWVSPLSPSPLSPP